MRGQQAPLNLGKLPCVWLLLKYIDSRSAKVTAPKNLGQIVLINKSTTSCIDDANFWLNLLKCFFTNEVYCLFCLWQVDSDEITSL